jgi:hypothetical protein
MALPMKTHEQVDAIMHAIPEEWRHRWCGGEYGPCACMGCVQIGNRAVIAKKITGESFGGDPEYLAEAQLQAHEAIYAAHKLTREEWQSWKVRHPKVAQEEGG